MKILRPEWHPEKDKLPLEHIEHKYGMPIPLQKRSGKQTSHEQPRKPGSVLVEQTLHNAGIKPDALAGLGNIGKMIPMVGGVYFFGRWLDLHLCFAMRQRLA